MLEKYEDNDTLNNLYKDACVFQLKLKLRPRFGVRVSKSCPHPGRLRGGTPSISFNINIAPASYLSQIVIDLPTMFKFLAILSTLALSSAFAPVARNVRSISSLKMGFEKEIGAQAPLGFWDPLGLMKEADAETFKLYRDIETKHGRVAMLAVLGHIVTAKGDRMPGDIAFGVPYSSMKAGLGALETVPIGGLVQLVLFIGVLEMGYTTRKDEIEKVHLEKSKWNKATIDRKLAIELNNGRAAQMGILGLMVHEKIDGNPYILNTLLGSPVPFN
jgi:Chlorophyll A-B binding protein